MQLTNRYELHSTFIEEYKKLADFKKNFMKCLLTEETEISELTRKVEEVNAQNETVQTAITFI